MKNFVLGTDEVIELPEFEDIKEYVYTRTDIDDDPMYYFVTDFNLDFTNINDEDYDAYEAEYDNAVETFRQLRINKILEELLTHLDPEGEDYKVIERNLYKF